MWITRANDGTRKLYNAAYMDKPVVFNDEGRARVTADVGKRLVAAGLAIEEEPEGVEEPEEPEKEDGVEKTAWEAEAEYATDESEDEGWQ